MLPGRRARPGARSSVRCLAAASNDNKNNVCVHSNQPYQSATASAGAYSHSYETNSSGYALMYLNGPSPGTRITVTVGSATCTTTD